MAKTCNRYIDMTHTCTKHSGTINNISIIHSSVSAVQSKPTFEPLFQPLYIALITVVPTVDL